MASQVHGTWRAAVRIRFPAALRAVGGWVQQASCRAPGDCSAGGTYAEPQWPPAGLRRRETGGKWDTARPISGTSAFRNVSVSVMSCASAGNCAAGGEFQVPDPASPAVYR